MAAKHSHADEAETGIQVLTFDLSGETFALEAELVREVIDLVPETCVPGAPPFVSAVINFRGGVIPLADLRLAFDLERNASTVQSRIVIIEHEIDGDRSLIGVRADKVHEVTAIFMTSTEPLPTIGTRWRSDFIRRLARRAGDVIILPDLAQIFASRGRAAADIHVLHPNSN